MSSSVKAGIRPPRVLVVCEDSDDSLKEVFGILSCLWGGIFCPILPVARGRDTTEFHKLVERVVERLQLDGCISLVQWYEGTRFWRPYPLMHPFKVEMSSPYQREIAFGIPTCSVLPPAFRPLWPLPTPRTYTLLSASSDASPLAVACLGYAPETEDTNYLGGQFIERFERRLEFGTVFDRPSEFSPLKPDYTVLVSRLSASLFERPTKDAVLVCEDEGARTASLFWNLRAIGLPIGVTRKISGGLDGVTRIALKDGNLARTEGIEVFDPISALTDPIFCRGPRTTLVTEATIVGDRLLFKPNDNIRESSYSIGSPFESEFVVLEIEMGHHVRVPLHSAEPQRLKKIFHSEVFRWYGDQRLVVPTYLTTGVDVKIPHLADCLRALGNSSTRANHELNRKAEALGAAWKVLQGWLPPESFFDEVLRGSWTEQRGDRGTFHTIHMGALRSAILAAEHDAFPDEKLSIDDSWIKYALEALKRRGTITPVYSHICKSCGWRWDAASKRKHCPKCSAQVTPSRKQHWCFSDSTLAPGITARGFELEFFSVLWTASFLFGEGRQNQLMEILFGVSIENEENTKGDVDILAIVRDAIPFGGLSVVVCECKTHEQLSEETATSLLRSALAVRADFIVFARRKLAESLGATPSEAAALRRLHEQFGPPLHTPRRGVRTGVIFLEIDPVDRRTNLGPYSSHTHESTRYERIDSYQPIGKFEAWALDTAINVLEIEPEDLGVRCIPG